MLRAHHALQQMVSLRFFGSTTCAHQAKQVACLESSRGVIQMSGNNLLHFLQVGDAGRVAELQYTNCTWAAQPNK